MASVDAALYLDRVTAVINSVALSLKRFAKLDIFFKAPVKLSTDQEKCSHSLLFYI